MAQIDQFNLEEQQRAQRATIFRVYNYYRILISFLFLLLFLDPNLKAFVGQTNPELFRTTILSYIACNTIIGITTLFVSTRLLSSTAPAFSVLIGDIIALTLLMSASGGVASGLGNFMFFTLAFGGGLTQGRISTVLPAIAFILTIYNEFYLYFLDENELQSFFQAGLLGIVYFVTNILFQTLSQQLRNRQTEVYTLEQINELIIETLKTGILVLSNDNTPKLMNQAAANFLGRRQTDEVSHKILPTTLLEAIEVWKTNPAKREVSFSIEPNGPELIASISELHTPSPDADILIFLEDSTEVQRQAQQLKLASLGRLSASIAHEIRNPLGAISHAAQLLGESPNLGKGDQRLCEIVQDQSVRMNEVIENVLDMSRRRTPVKTDINLKDWLASFVREFSPTENPDIRISISPDAQDAHVRMDQSHLLQVMSNLCQNGLRYSEKKTGKARVEIIVDKDAASGQVFLEVIDEGDGVPKEDLDKLFEPFHTTESIGTGLGLYLSSELCTANDARLTYRKAETGGASFRISFFD